MTHAAEGRLASCWARVGRSCLVVLAGLWACAPVRGDEGVNPFTGTPLGLEQARWALEQSRLEEQLQASLLSRSKLAAERAQVDAGAALPGTSARLPAANPSLPGQGAGSGPAQALAAQGAGQPRPVTARPGPAEPATLQGPPARRRPVAQQHASRHAVLGVSRGPHGWRVLVERGGELQLLGPGDLLQGQRVTSVDADHYSLDGQRHAIEIGAVRLSAPRLAGAAAAAGSAGLRSPDFADPVPEAALAGRAEGQRTGVLATGRAGVAPGQDLAGLVNGVVDGLGSGLVAPPTH